MTIIVNGVSAGGGGGGDSPLSLNDSVALELGTGADSKIIYDGTDTIWDLVAAGTGALTIGLTAEAPSPDGVAVHIWRGTAGSKTANVTAQLILENSTTVTLIGLCPANSIFQIFLESPTTNDVTGLVFYGASASPSKSIAFKISTTTRLLYGIATFAFQEATVISTTTGLLTLAGNSGCVFSTGIVTVNDNLRFGLGTGNDQVMINRSTSLNADTNIASVTQGTVSGQGCAANSLILSVFTQDGDVYMLAADGSTSKEYLHVLGASAILSLGYGMITTRLMAATVEYIACDATGLGFFAATPAARPTGVAETAAGILAALVTLGLVTAA